MVTQVLIVGAGPVGLTMAAELARYGVPVRIVEGGWTPEVILAWLEERKAARFHRPGPKPRQPSESDLRRLRAMARW